MIKKNKSKQSKEVIEKVKSIEEQIVSSIVQTIDDCKIENIVVKKCPTDYIASTVIIGTGSSVRHIAGSIEKTSIMIKQDYEIIPDLDTEGKEWGVLICGSIVLHLMTSNKRDHYKIEDLIDNLS